jgi:polysaccharide biosynthesis/export protein
MQNTCSPEFKRCGRDSSPSRRELLAVALCGYLALLTPLVKGQGLQAAQLSQPAQAAAPDTLPAFYPPGSAPRIRDYDVLRIKVFDVPELSGQYTVGPSGSVSLPLVAKPIRARGLTPPELSRAVSQELRVEGLVSRPEVTIEVKNSRLHAVVIGGAVKEPQIYPLFDHIALLDLLAEAGGLSSDAGDAVIVTRGQSVNECPPGDIDSEGGFSRLSCVQRSSLRLTVNLKELLENRDPHLNLDLCPGDRVTVERAGVVYVVGAVHRAGGFLLTSDRQPMTVLKAIALAEGLESTAIRKRSLIIHQDTNQQGERHEAVLNLNRIFAGKNPDPLLRANDILYVPDSTSQKALRRAAEAAVEITTGVVIFR